MNGKPYKKNKKELIVSALFLVILVGLDQITKYLAVTHLKGKSPFILINGVFQLQYLENTSAAFSFDPVSLIYRLFHITYFDTHPGVFLACKMSFFILLTTVVLVVLALVYVRIPWNRHFLPMNLILVGFCAGAAGNLIDRIAHRYVIDFFDFNLIHFPVFNVADIYVTAAAIGMIIVLFFLYNDSDYEMIFPSKKEKKSL